MIVTETYIYHCQTCGRIERHESASAVLQCCGKAMMMACAESHSIDEAVHAHVADISAACETNALPSHILDT